MTKSVQHQMCVKSIYTYKCTGLGRLKFRTEYGKHRVKSSNEKSKRAVMRMLSNANKWAGIIDVQSLPIAPEPSGR